VPKIKFDKLIDQQIGVESSDQIRSRVQKARDIQQLRFSKLGFFTNTEMSSRLTKEFCVVDQKTTELLRQAVGQFNISARSYFRILKIARTIADLAGQKAIAFEHVAEALQYRPKVE